MKTTFGIPSIGSDKTRKTDYQTLDGQPLIWRSTTPSSSKSKPTSVKTEVFEANTTTATSSSISEKKATETPLANVQMPVQPLPKSPSSSSLPLSTPRHDTNVGVNSSALQLETYQSSGSSQPSEPSKINDFTTRTYIIEKPSLQLDYVRSREIKPEDRLKFYEKKFEEIDKRRSLSRSPDGLQVSSNFTEKDGTTSSRSCSSASNSTKKASQDAFELPSRDNERNIDFEVQNRDLNQAAGHPYDDIKNESLDDIKNESPDNKKAPDSYKPLAAGVKAARPSVTSLEQPVPVYAKLNRHQSPMRPYDDPVHFKTDHIPKKKIIEDEGPVVDTKNHEKEKRDVKPKREGKKSYFTFGKGKKQKLKRQISGPVGGVVHYSGSSDRNLIKNLGVGLYDEGARTGDDPSAAGRYIYLGITSTNFKE